MADIRTIWDSAALTGDWLLAGGSLAADHDLETAVIISLFTDALAGPDDRLPDGSGDRRGWWADTGEGLEGPLGSRLWLLAREKQSEETRLRAEGYAREALRWLVTDGVAERVEVTAEWLALGRLGLAVTVHRRPAAGQPAQRYQRRFDWAWRQLAV